MSSMRRWPSALRRLTVVVAAVAASLAFAAPAYADDLVSVELGGLPNQMVVGMPSSLAVTVRNEADEDLASLRAYFTVTLAGLPVDGVVITRQGGTELPREGSNGSVTLADPATFELADGRRRTLNYTIVFTSTAPNGEAEVLVELYRGSDTFAGATSDQVRVRGGLDATSTTPPNTDPGVIQTFAPGPTVSIASLEATAASAPQDDGLPAILYAGGSLLIGLGAVVLWLMFRPDGPPLAAGSAAPGPGPVRGAATVRPAGGYGSGPPLPPPPSSARVAPTSSWGTPAGPPPPTRPGDTYQPGPRPADAYPPPPRPAEGYPPPPRPADGYPRPGDSYPPPARPPAPPSRRDPRDRAESFDPWDDGDSTFDPWDSTR